MHLRGTTPTECAGFALAALLALSCPGPSAAAATGGPDAVRVGGQSKRTTGRVLELQNGDISCVIVLEDEKGAQFIESGDFPICFQKPSPIGKWVRLAYRMASVQAESCQGDPECKKSERIALVVRATIIEGPGPSKDAVAGAGKAQAVETHCAPRETEVFGCTAGAKVISVCASKAVSPSTGHVQYRFGRAGEKPELVLPAGAVVPKAAATGTNVPFAGGGGSWMRFRSGSAAYVVYSGIGRWGPGGEVREKGGVVVERAGKAIANVRCTGKTRGELGPEWFERAGVGTGSGEDFLFP